MNTINVTLGSDAQLQLTVMRLARVGGQRQRLGDREVPLLRRLWRPDPNLARASRGNPPRPISITFLAYARCSLVAWEITQRGGRALALLFQPISGWSRETETHPPPPFLSVESDRCCLREVGIEYPAFTQSRARVQRSGRCLLPLPRGAEASSGGRCWTRRREVSRRKMRTP